MTTIEGNNLIAEFMGYINTTPTDPDFNIYENKEGKMLESMSMVYHSSWDWLMPVVEKIGMIRPIELHFSVAPSCYIYRLDIKNTFSESPIKNVWLSCVEFIQWYNQNM